MLALLFAPLAPAAQPAWWTTRGVVSTNAPSTNDYAIANVGQIKWFAVNALAEFEADFSAVGGAGDPLRARVAAVCAATGSDFRVINLGMLKNTVAPFYDRLIALGYATNYPWSDSTNRPDDYAVVNVGQIKYIFSFNFDSDGNGLPDPWEIGYFGAIGQDPNADPDHDDLTNLQKSRLGLDPLAVSTVGDGIPDAWKIANGLNPLDPAVADQDPDGDGLCNRMEYLLGTNPHKPSIFDASNTAILCAATPLFR